MSVPLIASIRPKTRPKSSRKKTSSISTPTSVSTAGLASPSALSKRSLKRPRLRRSGRTLFKWTPIGTKKRKAESRLPRCVNLLEGLRRFPQPFFFLRSSAYGFSSQKRSDERPPSHGGRNRCHRTGLSRARPGSRHECATRPAENAVERRGRTILLQQHHGLGSRGQIHGTTD